MSLAMDAAIARWPATTSQPTSMMPQGQFSEIRAACGLGSAIVASRMSNQIILEIVTDLLRLRVGHEIIATAALADRAVVILRDVGRTYARRRKFRFVDMTRN